MPSSANSANNLPEDFSSYRKPPASEPSGISQNWSKPTAPMNGPSHSSVDVRATSSRTVEFPVQERLLNAREVAERLGVSERWVRDHTTRRSPKIRGIKLGTLMRYRCADVEEFMEKLTTSPSSFQARFG